MSFVLPRWETGDRWQVRATLSHFQTGTSIFDGRVVGIENRWSFEVVEADERTIRLTLRPEVEADHAFAGHLYTLRFRRDDEGLSLASYREVSPASVQGREVSADGCRVFFRPGDSLGFLFDMPWLRAGLGPTFGAERCEGQRSFEEERVRYDEGLRFVWTYAFPSKTVVRTSLEWDDGARWYRRLLRERFNPADIIHTREVQASVRLVD